ncbi:hypothetical protein PYCCODRAFT_418464 [Trametes coccinea BRFM310]|uniref:Uncharacterized protein n=1 Tax=Trametes coccinea (strain BRFM310) TaxID=1353009 RepID=A0A1Y2IMC0_TRAC3|nr:hypothetical protein PYCCODRAFT_418464 [Trametes coccinea BRFM310]
MGYRSDKSTQVVSDRLLRLISLQCVSLLGVCGVSGYNIVTRVATKVGLADYWEMLVYQVARLVRRVFAEHKLCWRLTISMSVVHFLRLVDAVQSFRLFYGALE